MCMAYSARCECGQQEAGFNFHNEIMPPEVIGRLYCPACSRDIKFDPETMLADNGWIIQYDMDVARFSAHNLPVHHATSVTPGLLFDEGYATWRGVYPGDHLDNVRERAELVKLAKVDPRAYLEQLRTWANGRMERLQKEGWRKAVEQKV